MKTKKVKDARGPNARWLMPYLTVVDSTKSTEFYKNVFGFLLSAKHEEAGQIIQAEMTYHGQLIIMLCNEDAYESTKKAPISMGIEIPSSLYLYVNDVDEAVKKAQKAGAAIHMEPEDSHSGDRIAVITDLDGYVWVVATHVGVPQHHHHHDGQCCDHDH